MKSVTEPRRYLLDWEREHLSRHADWTKNPGCGGHYMPKFQSYKDAVYYWVWNHRTKGRCKGQAILHRYIRLEQQSDGSMRLYMKHRRWIGSAEAIYHPDGRLDIRLEQKYAGQKQEMSVVNRFAVVLPSGVLFHSGYRTVAVLNTDKKGVFITPYLCGSISLKKVPKGWKVLDVDSKGFSWIERRSNKNTRREILKSDWVRDLIEYASVMEVFPDNGSQPDLAVTLSELKDDRSKWCQLVDTARWRSQHLGWNRQVARIYVPGDLSRKAVVVTPDDDRLLSNKPAFALDTLVSVDGSSAAPKRHNWPKGYNWAKATYSRVSQNHSGTPTSIEPVAKLLKDAVSAAAEVGSWYYVTHTQRSAPAHIITNILNW